MVSRTINSPGRLAVFRRKFESVTRRAVADPAMFATELEILTVRGFGDMGTCARNRIVWDRFIADQRSCGLRRHLDSVPPDIPIREIVNRCRVWESHLEQKRGHSLNGFGLGTFEGVRGLLGVCVWYETLTQDSWASCGGVTNSGTRVVQNDIVGPRWWEVGATETFLRG